MPRARNIIPPPPEPDVAELISADQLRRYVAVSMFPLEDGNTHAEIGRKLGLSAGFVGMTLSGHREPSKKFLKAIGFERVTLYRPKR